MKLNKSLLVIMAAGAIALFAIRIGGNPQSTSANDPSQRLEGSWTYKVNVQGVPAGFPLGYTSLITFARDGGLVQTAWVPPATIALSTVVGVNPWIGHGEWARTSERQFALTVHIPRFDNAGNFVGLAKSRASIELNEGARAAS